ncbi:nitroreductase family protein [Ferrimonas marina]|uniref:Nitroreductase / dihydropteridine reductase n=1 Tax=Ferrimonas marina TaxID=299255 RepID=A0A1M5MWS9_9GAMM|nr:nitroreductase family protein [Ferrimonas marina]SHG81665.1 nitroreductase / dihydropteridine reductase [Ferrimonas marina]
MIQTLQTALEQRYSTKVFNPQGNAQEEKIQALLDTLCLAPTSINSQPWHLYLVTDAEQKAKMAKAAWEANAPKFNDGSHLFLFCAKTQFGEAEVREIEALVAQVRGTEVNEQRVAMMTNYVNTMTEEQRLEWMKRQVYLVFGQFLLSCALLDLDSCPVEGFLPEQMDQVLDLKAKGLTSVVAAVVGQRSEEDFNSLDKASKVRFGQDAMITRIV